MHFDLGAYGEPSCPWITFILYVIVIERDTLGLHTVDKFSSEHGNLEMMFFYVFSSVVYVSSVEGETVPVEGDSYEKGFVPFAAFGMQLLVFSAFPCTRNFVAC